MFPDRLSTAGMIGISAADLEVPWRIGPHGPIGSGTVSLRAVRSQIVDLALDQPGTQPAGTGGALHGRDEILLCLGGLGLSAAGAHDLIPSPAYIVIKAAEEFKDGKTTASREPAHWQTDFTYLKIMGWGCWYYLSTVLDDCSRASLSPGSSVRP